MGDVKTAIEGAVAYLSEHPDEASYVDSEAKAKLEEGLRVRVEGPGNLSMITDMPESVGGGNSGPSPGWVFRAALAACEATLIAMQAAREGVSLEALTVMVDSESDDRGILGMDPTVPAGPSSVRVRVSVRGAGGDLESLVRTAVERCPVHDAVTRPVGIQVETDAG
jgi:uncharacterized OsmC-like protein